MSEILNSPFTILTCALGISGWMITFIGLCTSHALTHSLSWWIVIFELLVVALSCAIFWTNTAKIYYPVILCLIAISIPYTTYEITTYISAGRESLSAAAAGYIIMMATQFIWIFLFGVQHDASVLQSFGDLNHHRVNTNSIHRYQKEHLHQQSSNIVFGDNTVLDMSYPTPTPTQNTYQSPSCCDPKQISPSPVLMDTPTSPQNTIFISPHSEYLHPVTAVHNYRANKEDPNELSFLKGEVLYVHEKKGSWWQAKKLNGAIGMIPSNYVTDQNTT